jgi:periplasmic protein TonB
VNAAPGPVDPTLAALRPTGWMPARPKYSSAAGATIVVLLHVAIVAALLQFDATRSALTAAVPIVVRLITPQEPQDRVETPPKALPVAPQVHRPKPATPPPLTTAVTEAPSSFVAPSPAIEAPLPNPQPAPAASTAPVSVPAPVVSAPAAPAAITPPSFNADYLNNPAPAYPTVSRRLHEEGKVVLRVFVNEQGAPAEVQLRNSSGFARLDSVAVDTVKHWRFLPARRGAEPVAAWVLVPISFSLRS